MGSVHGALLVLLGLSTDVGYRPCDARRERQTGGPRTKKRTRTRSILVRNDDQKRGGLRRRIAERWTPLFDEENVVDALTADEFADACDWERLRASGVVDAHENPLSVAGLRLSSLFPRHLLRRRDDGRLVPIALDDAVALVRLTVAQNGRTARTVDQPDQVDARSSDDPAGGATAAGDGVAETSDEGAAENRRRFFRRRG